MTPPSDHEPPSTTSSTPVQLHIARWRQRRPWIVCGMSLIVILGMGVVIHQLRSQITAYQRDQQTVRTMANTILRDDISDVLDHLMNAQIASEQHETAAMVDNLYLARRALYDAYATTNLYGIVLFHDEPGRPFELGFMGYASAIEELAVAIEQRRAILPADRDHLSIIQADFDLMWDSFPSDLLRDGRAEDIVTAQTAFCLGTRLHILLGSDAPSMATCTRPGPESIFLPKGPVLGKRPLNVEYWFTALESQKHRPSKRSENARYRT
jgi:hypothetical protein